MVKLLDCTLRDGGYVNDWCFGHSNIRNAVYGLVGAGVDIVELGFLRNGILDENRSVFSDIKQADSLIFSNGKALFSVMIEAFDPFPLERLVSKNETAVDFIRVCVWKRCLDEHLLYCRGILNKGYPISIQPSRVEQYSESEFVSLIKRVNELRPYSFYVVDTWGTQNPDQIETYLRLADAHLSKDILLGYHGHNNMLQALPCALRALSLNLDHDLILDSSLFGMGRGAGNLNTELIIPYLNSLGGRYDVSCLPTLIEKTILPFWQGRRRWGYSPYYFLSALRGCNPNFATYFQERGLGVRRFERFLSSLDEPEKIAFNEELILKRLSELNDDEG